MHLRYPSLLSQKSFYVNILAFQQTYVGGCCYYVLSATEKKLVERTLRRVFCFFNFTEIVKWVLQATYFRNYMANKNKRRKTLNSLITINCLCTSRFAFILPIISIFQKGCSKNMNVYSVCSYLTTFSPR